MTFLEQLEERSLTGLLGALIVFLCAWLIGLGRALRGRLEDNRRYKRLLRELENKHK